MTVALGALEKYIHAPLSEEPHLLVRLALIHYQFEAIHPFPDGNGRVGRLLIPLIMAETMLMPQPLLYLSPYFERRQGAYYDYLLDVSRVGGWEAWIQFFLRGIIEQCEDTVARVTDLQRLNGEYRDRLRSGRAAGLPLQLVDLVFESPYLSVPLAQRRLDASYAGARKALDRLTMDGVLRLESEERPRIYSAPAVFEIINRPFGASNAAG
jgi:Fic family protein